MSEAPLTGEAILDAAAQALRRYGLAKTTVVDVARALGVSHGSIYRHFSSKAALRDAVAERWLAMIAGPLAEIAARNEPAPARLRAWIEGLAAFKQGKAREDPELFAAYHAAAEASGAVVAAHVAALVGQLARIIADGMGDGSFRPGDPVATARALFQATGRFHHPAHAGLWNDPQLAADFEAVWSVLMAGLAAR